MAACGATRTGGRPMNADGPPLVPRNGDDGATVADPSPAKDIASPRRMFLRKMTADAVRAGGRLAGSARIIRQSAAAAGETLLRELEQVPTTPQEPITTTGGPALLESSAPVGADALDGFGASVGLGAPVDRAPGISAPREPISPTEPISPAEPADDPSPQDLHATRSPQSTFPPLTPAQVALLESRNPVVLATIQSGRAPQLTASPFHWDGRVFRISALDWTARTQNIQIDPRVSLLIADPFGGLSLSVTGSAAVAAGPSARDDTLPILRKYAADESEVASRWAELNADEDRLVIVVVPERMLWRFDEPAWRSRDTSEP